MSTDISMYVEVERNATWHLLTEPKETSLHEPKEIYFSEQNYDLFAILADVRNPTGRTVDHQLFDVIAPWRGLPNDLSVELRNYFAGETNASWLLLSEVLRFDWHGKVIKYEAMVDARVAHLFEESKPFPAQDQWPQDIPTSYATWDSDGVTVRWTDTYAVAANTFLAFLETLKPYGEPSKIRLVFEFWH
jgi:hypothetical protein